MEITKDMPVYGAVQCLKEDNAWTPRRFSTAQLALYAKNEGYRIRSIASSGVCIECITDAEAFLLEAMAFSGSSQDLWAFDVLVDHQLYAHREGSIAREKDIVWQQPLPPGKKRVKLCFPHLAGVNVKRFEWVNASVVLPVAHRERLLCLGDSITQGYVTHFASYAYPHQLAEALDAVLINQAIGGENFDPPMLDGNLGFAPTIVTIAYGTNDWRGKSREAFLRDARDYLVRARSIWPDAWIAVISPIWRPDAAQLTAQFPFEELHSLIEQATEGLGMTLIDGGCLVPPIGELFHDGVHPNDLGMLLFGKYLAREIQKLMV